MELIHGRGRNIEIETRGRVSAAKEAAEKLFQRYTYPKGRAPAVPRVAPIKGRILEDAPKLSIFKPEKKETPPVDETPVQRVMRFIATDRIEDAARLAKRIIDSGNGHKFFTHDGDDLGVAREWFSQNVAVALSEKRGGFQTITPPMAQVLLESNHENRPIDAAGLAKRMRDMLAGRWSENGETVIIAKNAMLNDGQHRCWASLLMGLAFTTNMAWGVDRQSRTTVDAGTKRSVGSQLSIRGEKGGAQKAGIVAEVFKIFIERQATDSEKEEFYFKHQEDIDFSWSLTNNRMPARHARSAISAAIFYMETLGVNREQLNEFMGIVRTKLGHTRGCPAFILREELVEGRAKRSSREWALATIQHFILWSKGKKTYKLSIPKVAPAQGDF